MIIAGFGFRKESDLESMRDALERAADGRPITALATIADKADCPAIQALADALNLPLHRIPPFALADTDTPTDSPASRAARQTGSVAEATALLAAGPGGRLIQTRVISADRTATCALAETAGQSFKGDPS